LGPTETLGQVGLAKTSFLSKLYEALYEPLMFWRVDRLGHASSKKPKTGYPKMGYPPEHLPFSGRRELKEKNGELQPEDPGRSGPGWATQLRPRELPGTSTLRSDLFSLGAVQQWPGTCRASLSASLHIPSLYLARTSNIDDRIVPFSRSLEHFPFAQLISAARQRQGLSLNAVARGMHAAARQEGTHCGTTRQAVLGYERGRVPYPEALRWLAAALGLPFEEVAAAARQQRRSRLELRVLASAESVEAYGEPCGTLEADVRRRELLALFGRAAKAGLLASTLPHLSSVLPTSSVDNKSIEAVTSASRIYRQLW